VKEVLVIEKVNLVRGGMPLLIDGKKYASILTFFLKFILAIDLRIRLNLDPCRGVIWLTNLYCSRLI